MSNYDDYDDPRSGGRYDDRGRAPPPYPASAAPFNDYSTPGQPQHGADVPPPPMGEQLNRPSAMKRSGSQSRVPHLQPQFPDEASYLGSHAPDLEAKNRRHHREFRDKRDGYESEEGENHRRSKYGDSRGDRGDPRGDPRGGGGQRGGGYDERDRPPRRRTHDEEEPRRRKDKERDRDRDYDDPPSRHRKRDPPGVEYGSDPVPAVKRSQTDRDGRRRRKDDYDDEDDYDDRDRRRPERRRSHDDTRRRRRDYDDDDRSDYNRDDRRRRDRSRDDRRRDRSRRRDDDDDSEYDDRRSRRDGDRDRDRRRRSSAPPKEVKIGDYDIGPLLEKGKKHYGTIAPIITPFAMSMARKYLGGSGKR